MMLSALTPENAVIWLTLGNVLYLCSYAIRDILWLRILSVVGALCLIVYYMGSIADSSKPIAWNLLFISVNLVQIGLLIWERRPVFFSEKETEVYNRVFRTLSPREFYKLHALGTWSKVPLGGTLVEQGQGVDRLSLISSGAGTVAVDDRPVAVVSSYQFVGEMAYLTNAIASANVIARSPVELLSWPIDKLEAFKEDHPAIHSKLQGILGVDLVEKLRQEGHATAHPSQVIRPTQD